MTRGQTHDKTNVVGSFQLHLHHVISFYFLAKEQSFAKAAQRLSVTQPAISQHIHCLELQFGVRLVSMKGKRPILTRAGERLLPYAEKLVDEAVITESFLKSYRSNNLSIGIANALLSYLTAVIDMFKAIHPSVRISVREGSSLALVEELLDFRHDVCVLGVPGTVSPNERLRLYRIPWEEPIVFVASQDYPLPLDRPVTWSELASHPLIVKSEGSVARAIVFQHFAKRGLKPIVGAEANNIQFVKELTRQKKGVSFMHDANVRNEIARGDLRIIEVEDGYVKSGPIDVLVSREAISPAAMAFLDVIKQYFGGTIYETPS